ncbi:unnamed protein product [Rotaria magnacalcarata]
MRALEIVMPSPSPSTVMSTELNKEEKRRWRHRNDRSRILDFFSYIGNKEKHWLNNVTKLGLAVSLIEKKSMEKNQSYTTSKIVKSR